MFFLRVYRKWKEARRLRRQRYDMIDKLAFMYVEIACRQLALAHALAVHGAVPSAEIIRIGEITSERQLQKYLLDFIDIAEHQESGNNINMSDL